MTKRQFLQNFYCTCVIHNQGNVNLQIVSKVLRRRDNAEIDQVVTNMDINETTEWIIDSQSRISLIPFDWEKIIDQVKRAQLDYFMQRAHITDYYPLNTTENPDISDMY